MKQVVEDEVATDRGGRVDLGGIVGEEVADIAKLDNEQNKPVDGGDGGILCETRTMGIVLAPNGPANEVSIVRRFEIVVNGRDDGEDPREQSQDLVSGDGCRAMRFPLREGVEIAEVRHNEQAKGSI